MPFHEGLCSKTLKFACFLFSGLYDIFVEIDGKPQNVGHYDNRGFFGELALMYNMPRAATIVATTEGSLWALVSSLQFNSQDAHQCVSHHCVDKLISLEL